MNGILAYYLAKIKRHAVVSKTFFIYLIVNTGSITQKNATV